MLCPKCHGRAHRSHARSFAEKLVRALTSRRFYHCHECGWRGWLRRRNSAEDRHRLRTIISVLVTLLITTLLALYVVEKLSVPAPGPDYQQQVP